MDLIEKYNLQSASSVPVDIAKKCCQEFWNWFNGPDGHPEHFPEEEVIRFGMKIRSQFKGKNERARVLDLGCGSGKHTVFLASLGFEVSGLDWSEGGNRYIEKQLADKDLSAKLTCSDYAKHPFPYDTNYFDAIVATQVFDHLVASDAEKVRAECSRVLKPGGRMLCTIMSTRTSKSTRVGIPLEGESHTELVSSGNSAGEIHRFLSPEEMKSFVSEGFSVQSWAMVTVTDQISNEVAEAGYFVLQKV